MIKKILLLGIGLLPLFLKAQVTINAQLPPAGFVTKDQLWNLVLVNNNEESLEVNVRMDLKEAVSGQVILSANTGNFTLDKGVKALTSGDMQPITYNFTLPGYSNDFLPLGSYTACYQVIAKKEVTPLGEDCVAINIDPLSPPLLNTPVDATVLQTHYPQFTWIPPAPLDVFSNLNYDLVVVEVLEGQSSSEAIQYNVPIYNSTNIADPLDNYPSTYTPLDTGKLYAWQVTAKNATNYSAKTDVWTFEIESPVTSSTTIVGNEAYILLQNTPTGNYVVKNSVLHLKYYSYDAECIAKIDFTNEKGDFITDVKRKTVLGNNYIDIKLGRRFFQKGRKYKAVLTDKQGKKYSITFGIQ